MAFAPGRAELDAASREQLQKVAKALANRTGLRLTVVGHSDPAAEQDAWRRARRRAGAQAPLAGAGSGAVALNSAATLRLVLMLLDTRLVAGLAAASQAAGASEAGAS